MLRTRSAVAVVAALALSAVACTPTGTDAPAPARTQVAPPVTTTEQSLPDQQLDIISHPDGADVSISTADGSTITGTTPYGGEVPGGDTELTVTLDGFEPVTRQLVLDEARELTLWLDPAGQVLSSVLRFDSGSNPKQVAYTPDGAEIWSSLLGGRGVQVFDAETGEKREEIELGEHGAVEVIFNADGSRAYASQMETASVYEIDTAEREVVRQLSVEGAWTKVLALSPDERTLYASNWSSDNVSEIDLEEWEVSRLIPTVRTPRGLYPTPDGQHLYVAGYAAGEIQRIDLDTGDGEVLHRSGGAARHMVGDEQTVYVSDMGTAQIYAVDLATDEVREFAKTDEKPNTIGLSPDGAVLYISCRGKNNPQSYYIPGPEWGSVLAIDTASGNPLDAIVAGNQTTGLDVSADGSRLVVSDFLDNLIRVYAIPDHADLVAGDGGRYGDHRADLPK